MPRFGLIHEFWDFLAHRKKLWMFPIVILLLLLGLVVVLTAQSSLAPFIYALF